MMDRGEKGKGRRDSPGFPMAVMIVAITKNITTKNILCPKKPPFSLLLFLISLISHPQRLFIEYGVDPIYFNHLFLVSCYYK